MAAMGRCQVCCIVLLCYTLTIRQVCLQVLDCKSNIRGSNYGGDISTTRRGYVCQRWDVMTPHVHDVTDTMMVDGSRSAARNYCRSPDFDHGGPWCFTTDPAVKWDYCDVPTCNQTGCIDSLSGVGYIGAKAVTVTGHACTYWSNVGELSAYGFLTLDPVRFPDGKFEHNLCRNPLGAKDRPWCYSANLDAEWEFCDIPLCAWQHDPAQAAILPTRHCELQGGSCIRQGCCADNYYVTGLCAEEGLTCCLSRQDCTWQQDQELTWPKGSYSLPSPIFGCPSAATEGWRNTLLSLTLRDGHSLTWSYVFHLAGPYTHTAATLQLCERQERLGPTSNMEWPQGQYCIYRASGQPCPLGFSTTDYSIELGASTSYTTIGWNRSCDLAEDSMCLSVCCREDGNNDDVIHLPTAAPFMLLKLGEQCQAVSGMDSLQEQLRVNLGQSATYRYTGRPRADLPLTFINGTMTFNFCYYQNNAPETCYNPMDRGLWYRGNVNMTSEGPCSPWSKVAKIDHYKHYHHMGLDDTNYCRNTLLFNFEEQPWCYAGGQKVHCGVPVCEEGQFADLVPIGEGRAARQQYGSIEQAQLAVDGDPLTCSQQTQIQAWWQVDLQGVYSVGAIGISRHNVDQCVLRFINIHVGMSADDFLSEGALLCARNVTIGSMEETMTRCVQPVRGQHITISNLVYIESETYTDDYEKCFVMCEVQVFVRDTFCGRRLLEQTVANQIQPYIRDSTGRQEAAHSYSLHSPTPWCIKEPATHPYLLVNLLFPRRIQSVVLHGTEEGDAMVTEFYVKFGFYESDLIYYEDYPGVPKVFRNDPEVVAPQIHHLLTDITASLVLIEPLSNLTRACMRLDILGCIKEYDNLVKPEAVSQSSSTLTQPMSYSTDNDVMSCTTTLSEEGATWELDMGGDVRVHSMVVETGLLFAWNLAGGKDTYAITQAWSGYAWRANDGRIATTNYWHGSCSHTFFHYQPWWAVDMGQKFNVTTVIVTNRGDCCNNRLDTFLVLVGNTKPADEQAINITDYKLCKTHDRYFGAGDSHVVECDSPLVGRYIFIVLLAEAYLTVCELQAFGDRDPFLVSVGPARDADWSLSTSLCQPQSHVPLAKSTHVFNCAGTPPGRYLISSVRGLGPMSVCTALVYGGVGAVITTRAVGGREYAYVSCAVGTTIQLQWTPAGTNTASSTRDTSSHIRLARQDLLVSMGLCEGRRSCRLPAPVSNRVTPQEVVSATVVCSYTKTREEKCNMALRSESLIQSPNFPYYYGMDLKCRWEILAPEGNFVALNTSVFMLAGKVDSIKDGCLEFNLGVCEDRAMVTYSPGGANILVETAALFMSDTNYLVLQLKSCFRQATGVRDGKYGIQAQIKFEDCAGCSTQYQTTGASCAGPCGHIVSYGYPSLYKPNDRMEWRVVVDNTKYISIRFVGFDVYEHILEKCERDYVLVYDVDLVGEKTTSHRFCNSDPPRNSLISSWYQMVIEFITDATIEGRGFHAMYEEKTYQPTEDIPPPVYSHPDCPEKWLWFESSCYNLERSPQPLTWQDAEDSCRSVSSRGHLVSIANHQEMTFLHFMLSTLWRSNQTSTFIGLTDRQEEGIWRWSDDSPVTYSAWSASSGYSNLRQPDGAQVEDCAMIRLDSIHGIDSWHDIPCAYDQVTQYLCEVNTGSTKKETVKKAMVDPTTVDIGVNRVTCQNGEFLLAYLWCDGKVDCRDRSDEQNCSITEGGCSETNFQCADGTCVSMSVYCDYKQDCADNSDEATCVKPNCTSDDFRCDNGECIRYDQRCDLLVNCQDASDEQQCVRCSEEPAFQCFDGTCISRNKRCDGVVDCPGALHEDESEDCVTEAIEASCQAWKLAGSTSNAKYLINPQGKGAFEVDCDMTSDPDQVITILHHDSETRQYVSGYPNPGSYIHPINYAATINQIKSMKLEVDQCEQYVTLECYGASGTTDDFWENVEGSRVPWVIPTDSNCKCSLSAACSANRTRCWCQDSETIVPRLIVVDQGWLTSFVDLPMTAISLSRTSFKDKQYQYHTVGPLLCYQGGNATRDEIKCGSGQFIAQSHRCMYDVNSRGDVLGCRDAAHLEQCTDFQCPHNSFKCPGSFCIPLRMVCDFSQDCLNGEDESNCKNFSCPGMYKCWDSNFCIESSQQCDGQRHCPLGDDELLCDIQCPAGCTCTGLTFLCRDAQFTTFPPQLPDRIRKMDMTGNKLAVKQGNISRFEYLGELLLGGNGIDKLEPYTFMYLSNLYKLDLSDNNFGVLQQDTFNGLLNLKVLVMKGNHKLMTIEMGAFTGLIKLPVLEMRNLSLTTIQAAAFTGMPLLRQLDLSMNKLVKIPLGQFEGLERLISLNVSGNPEISMMRLVLDDLQHLQFLQSDNFKYCCFVSNRVPEHNCLPERDELSSCQDLMRRDMLKAFLWILGLMALLFNIFVLIYRARERMSVYSFSVFNLAAADLLMGVYMVTLAVVDLYYRGVYIEYAEEWTQSWLCKLLGFLNAMSSEASVFMLCLISGDRFYNIVFPFKALSSGKSGLGWSKYAMATVWFVAFFIAVLPLFPIDYFKGRYYSRSGMCISIYLTNEKTPGWEFSVFIFHFLNFFSFMFIFLSYAYMYKVVVASSRSSTGKATASEAEIKLAKRMTLVVATDFLCWVPINIMGALALGGVGIPGEVYAWVVVFLLPVNSAINPLLYTITAMKKSKAKTGQPTESSTKISQLFYIHVADQARSLKEHLGLQVQLPVKEALRLIKGVTQVVADAHIQQRPIGVLDVNTIVVFNNDGGLKIGVQILRRPPRSVYSIEDDINQLGKVAANILRRCAVK